MEGSGGCGGYLGSGGGADEGAWVGEGGAVGLFWCLAWFGLVGEQRSSVVGASGVWFDHC